jgi:hypothetical protein
MFLYEASVLSTLTPFFMETKQKFKKLLGYNVRRVCVDRRLSVEKLALEVNHPCIFIQHGFNI